MPFFVSRFQADADPRHLVVDGVLYVLEEVAEEEAPEAPEPLTDDPRAEDTPSKKRGKWTPEEKCDLFLAANSRRNILRGSFLAAGGGKKQKDRTWDQVAGMHSVNFLQ